MPKMWEDGLEDCVPEAPPCVEPPPTRDIVPLDSSERNDVINDIVEAMGNGLAASPSSIYDYFRNTYYAGLSRGAGIERALEDMKEAFALINTIKEVDGSRTASISVIETRFMKMANTLSARMERTDNTMDAVLLAEAAKKMYANVLKINGMDLEQPIVMTTNNTVNVQVNKAYENFGPGSRHKTDDLSSLMPVEDAEFKDV